MKKKALVFAIGLALATPTISVAKALPSNIIGLSLGEIQSQSYLNEPFKGIIPILFANREASKKLKVKLASKTIFQKVGAEKLAILNDLQFHVDIKNNKPVIFIKSTRPIQMPFLNFVLEIEGPQGTIYQDYTTLLDPKETAINTFLTKNQNIEQQSKSILPISVSSSSIILDANRTHKVKAGDTLSQIAQALNAADISLKKMVTAIHTKNPNAFINNNIDRLKAGAVLHIPTKNELKSSSFKVAAKNALQKKPSNFNGTSNNENTYTIKRGDNLSTITKKLGHGGISFTKMMKAIHTANPHAFSKNKINLLKVGKILTIPPLREITTSNTTFEQVKAVPNLIILNDPKPEIIENTKEFILDGFVIEKGDTLAKITKQIGHKSIPYSEMMHAIYVANPDAFEKNNITTLIEGAIIRLPSIAEIKEISSKNTEAKPNNSTEEPIESDTTAPIESESSNTNQPSNNANNFAIIKLEKRVRELKRGLNKAHSNLSNLELSLASKENLLKQQSTDLSKLATTLELLNNGAEKKKPDPIDKNDEELQQILAELSTPESLEESTSSGESPDTETTGTIAQSEIIKSDVLATTRSGYMPVEVNQVISEKITNKLAEYSQYMSGKELFATILALLFGLILIRYRREIYAYTNISYDHPKYYPPFGEEEAKALLKEKTINFQDTLIDIPSDIHGENKPEFSDEHIQECEDLAEELIEDLELKKSVHSDNTDWTELDKACDDYIEEYRENSIVDITDVSDNIIEDTKFEPEEMTFEVFEALAEGVIKKESNDSTKIVEKDTMIYGLNNDQAELYDIFEDKQSLPFSELTKLSDKIDKEKIQAS